MGATAQRLLLSGLLGAAALAVACQDELPTTGSIVLNVQFAEDAAPPSVQEALAWARAATRDPTSGHAEDDPGVRVDLPPSLNVSSFTSVRATAAGPITRSTNLVLTDGFWEGEITGLEPGSYTVTVEAFTNNELAEVGTSSATVTAGGSSTASVTLQSFRPTLNAIGAPGTIMGFAVTWTSVANATGYRVEWSKATDFAGALTQTVTDGTTTLVAVSDTGTWNLRVRATATGTTGSPPAGYRPRRRRWRTNRDRSPARC
jgi:hypothetical protein